MTEADLGLKRHAPEPVVVRHVVPGWVWWRTLVPASGAFGSSARKHGVAEPDHQRLRALGDGDLPKAGRSQSHPSNRRRRECLFEMEIGVHGSETHRRSGRSRTVNRTRNRGQEWRPESKARVETKKFQSRGPSPGISDRSWGQSRKSVERRVLTVLGRGPLSRSAISKALGHRSVSGGFKKAIQSLMTEGLIEYVIPGKPNSRLQKYRLTERGRSSPGALPRRGHDDIPVVVLGR